MRKLSLVIAGILGAGSPLIGQAATLGQAQVQSYLSEPLEARVPLMRTSDEPLDEITVQLAPASFYRDAGVPLSNLTGNLTFTIESDGGQEYVRIGSNRPIRDPILSFLLQIESPQGRMIRSYNLLLDPPSAATAAEPSAAPDTASGTVASLTSAAAPDWQRVAPASDIELDATRKVELGDTLSGIARDYVREGDDLRAVMQAIIDANPQAFANGNGNAMMAGATLNVPSPTSDSNASAAREPTQGATDQASAQAPALELLTPTEEGANGNTDREADQEVSEGIAPLTRTNPLPAIGDAAPATGAQTEREAALTQEELESARAENQALTGQLESLKKEVESVKVAVETRDTTIAELKETVAQARQEAEQAEALRNSFWLQWGKFLVGGMGLLILALLIALGLRRSRREDEPALATPMTATNGTEPRVDPHEVSMAASRSGALGMATGVEALDIPATDGRDEVRDELSGADATGDDSMSPAMVLEEARVLESFNLTHQALELLRESLNEHPGHPEILAAIDRLTVTGPAGDDVTATNVSSKTSESWETGLQAEDRQAQSGPVDDDGDIAWDDDVDDMLATPEPQRESHASDDNLMEFDDSFALETPSEETSSDENPGQGTTPPEAPMDADSGHRADDIELALPGEESPEADQDAQDPELGERHSDPTTLDPGLDLELTPEPGAEPEAEAPREIADLEEGNAADVDTRVSLAEAFLDVGDRESFDMIEAELREEGATLALDKLDELKHRHGT